MDKISFSEFVAEIESKMSVYSDSNDIDYQSIKTAVIQALRKFGKNICEKSETIVEVKNNSALLPETFKSLTLAVKVDTQEQRKKDSKQLINEKIYIENPAIWSSMTLEYIVDYCQTKIVTEKTYANKEHHIIYDLQPLSLEPYINQDTLDVNCFNLMPQIRNNYPNKISIVNRTLRTNFKEGFVYVQYNSLPSLDGEIAIPIFTNQAIYDYILMHVQVELAENIILNNKASQGLIQIFQMWKQELPAKKIEAQFEAKSNGLSSDWTRKFYKQKLINRRIQGL